MLIPKQEDPSNQLKEEKYEAIIPNLFTSASHCALTV